MQSSLKPRNISNPRILKKPQRIRSKLKARQFHASAGRDASCMMGSCFVGNDCLMTVIEIREMSVRCGERARKQEVHNTRRFCTSLPGIVVEAAAVKDLDCRGAGLTYFGAKQFFFPAN